MPVADPRAGRAFVWLASCFILLSLAAGGCLLIMYMIQPRSQYSVFLLYTGMILVCVPWIFWFLMCSYRFISRTFGFRFVCGGGGSGGGGDGGGGGGPSTRRGDGGVASGNLTSASAQNLESSNVDNSPTNGTGQVHFGTAIVVNEHDGDGDDDDHNRGNSLNNASFRSHESEIPLASAMAT